MKKNKTNRTNLSQHSLRSSLNEKIGRIKASIRRFTVGVCFSSTVRHFWDKLEKDFLFKIFQYTLKKYNVDFFYKDEMGILTKRKHDDNFKYIFSTKYSCDSMPMMITLNSQIKNSNICVDVGANIGITAIWMAKNSKKVYAFEPVPDNVNRLVENLEANNILNVNIIKKAVSNKNGDAILTLFNSYGHHSLSSKHISSPKGAISVETITLDKFAECEKIDKIDVLKIDVEGFELEVLQGAKKMLTEKRVNMIIFEHAPILMKLQDRKPSEVVEFLIGLGYSIYRLDGTEITLQDSITLEQQDLYAK